MSGYVLHHFVKNGAEDDFTRMENRPAVTS